MRQNKKVQYSFRAGWSRVQRPSFSRPPTKIHIPGIDTYTDFLSLVVMPFRSWGCIEWKKNDCWWAFRFFPAAQNAIWFYLASPDVRNNASEGKSCDLLWWDWFSLAFRMGAKTHLKLIWHRGFKSKDLACMNRGTLLLRQNDALLGGCSNGV